MSFSFQAVNDNLDKQMRAYVSRFVSDGNYPFGKLKDYTTMQYGYTETATDVQIGPKFLRITDISQNSIDWNGVPHCPCTHVNHDKYVLHEGDIVVARTGATVGYAKMLGKSIPDAVFASFLVRIQPFDYVYRHYFGLSITSDDFLNYVQMNAGGSAQPQANPPLLGEYELSIPRKEDLYLFENQIQPILIAKEQNEMEISKLQILQQTMIEMISSR